MLAFKLKIQTPTIRDSDSFLEDKFRRKLYESGGDGTSKSSVGNPMKLLENKPMEPKVKNYVDLEWSLLYVEEDGVLLLIFVKSEGKGKLELGKTFTYDKLRNVEYEDNDSLNLIIDVEILGGTRRVLVDEGNLVFECCSPKILQKDIQTKNNPIVALHPYVTGELMIIEVETPPKKSQKSNLNIRSTKNDKNLMTMN